MPRLKVLRVQKGRIVKGRFVPSRSNPARARNAKRGIGIVYVADSTYGEGWFVAFDPSNRYVFKKRYDSKGEAEESAKRAAKSRHLPYYGEL